MSDSVKIVIAAVLSSGVLIAIIEFIRFRRGDKATVADVYASATGRIAESAEQMMKRYDEDNRRLRDEVVQLKERVARLEQVQVEQRRERDRERRELVAMIRSLGGEFPPITGEVR